MSDCVLEPPPFSIRIEKFKDAGYFYDISISWTKRNLHAPYCLDIIG